MEIKSVEVPNFFDEILFKYMTYENAVKTVAGQYLWASCPIDFDDPYDTQFVLGFNTLETNLIGHDKFEMSLKRQIKVISLAKKWDNAVLWYHYAEKYKGVCLGFSTKSRMGKKYLSFDSGFVEARKVDYSRSSPVVLEKYDIEGEDTDTISTVFTSKSPVWAFEEEYRAIFQSNPQVECDNRKLFDKQSLRCLILGKDINEESATPFIELLNKYNDANRKMPLYRIKPKRNDFSFDLEQIIY